MALNIKNLLLAFVAIVVGIALLNAIADTVFENTNLYEEKNETVSLNGSRTFAATSDINESGFNNRFALANNFTGITAVRTTNNTLLVENTDWNQSANYLYLINSSAVIDEGADPDGNITLVTYNYQQDNYVDHSLARTLLRLITLFFGIGLLMFVIFYIRNGDDLLSDLKGLLDK